MSIAENLIDFLIHKPMNTALKAPEDLCPNCWGSQEYEGNFYEAIKSEGIDTNNVEQKKGWIQAYAEKNLTGIQLKKKGNKLVCQVCQ